MEHELDRAWRELERLRDRIHDVTGIAQGASAIAKNNRSLLRDIRRELDELKETVENMSQADEIAEAVARKVGARGPVIPLHWAWKATIGLSVVVAIAGGIKGLLS